MIQFQVTCLWWLDVVLLVGLIMLIRKPLPTFLVLFGFILTQIRFKPFIAINSLYEWIYEVSGILCILAGGYFIWGEPKTLRRKNIKPN